MVGAEDVDRPVEAALELVHEVGDVRRAVRRRAVFRAKEDPVLLVAVRGRPRPERAVLLVRVETRQELGQPLLELALQPEAVEVDAEPLERRLDLLQHQRHRIALQGGEVVDVRTPIAVLRWLLAAPHRLDRRPEPLHLRARVVVVVLALDLVPGEREQAGERVAVGAVASRRDRNRAGRVRGDHLDLDTLTFARRAPAPYASPSSRISASADENHSSRRKRLTKPGPATSARSTTSRPAAACAISAAISRGGRRRVPASCSATFVA